VAAAWTRQRLAQLVAQAESRYGIPQGLLARIISVESAWNPAATAYDKNGSVDRGIAQINSIHTDVSNAQAYDPTFAIPWAARFLAYWRSKCGSWDAAVQAYNLGHCGSDPSYLAAVTGTAPSAGKSAGTGGSSPGVAPTPTWIWVAGGALALVGLLILA